MPILKSAKKKLRQDKKKRSANAVYEKKFKEAVKKLKSLKTKMTPTELANVYKAIDKAAKKGIIHKNKAARIKSGVAKFLSRK